MNKYMKIAEEIIENNYSAVGVRSVCEDEQYNVGDDCRQSYEWDLENDCSTYDIDGEDGMKAGGTCATQFDSNTDEIEELAARIEETVKGNAVYSEGKQVIIAGHDGINNDYAMDDGEIRIRNAFVIAIV